MREHLSHIKNPSMESTLSFTAASSSLSNCTNDMNDYSKETDNMEHTKPKAKHAEQNNLYHLLQPLVEALSHLLYQMNLLVLVAFAWLITLTLALIFSFITPWPLFLPSLILAFSLGYFATQLQPHFTFTHALKLHCKTITTHLHSQGNTSTILTQEKSVIQDAINTTSSESVFSLSEKKTTYANLTDLDVPNEEAEFPPIEKWSHKIYPRLIEENWVIHELKKQDNQKNENLSSTWQFPSNSVNYPLGALKIKGRSSCEDKYMNYFETPYFKGKILLRFSGGGSDMDDGYFDGRKRYTQTCIQGKFKYPYKFSEVLTGQKFRTKFTKLPPSWLLKLLFLIIKRVSPNMLIDIVADKPYALSPLVTAAQSIHVANDPTDNGNSGNILPPDITQREIVENTSLLGGHFAKKVVTPQERKNYFREICNLNNYQFETEYIYTIDFYQHIFNPMTYEFNCGMFNMDISPYLNYQAIESMAVIDKSKFYQIEKLSTEEKNTTSSDNTSNQNKENEEKSLENSIANLEEKNCYLWRIQFGHEKVLNSL